MLVIPNPAPARRSIRQAGNADYVVPNETEAEALTGMPVREIERRRAALTSPRQRTAPGLPRRCRLYGYCAGSDGMRHVPAFAVNPVTQTGAGDAFTGSFACFLAGGCEETEAIA